MRSDHRGKQEPIFELECLAMLTGVKAWANHLRHKHVILFTDNNGSLGAMISGVSRNATGADMVHCFDAFVDSLGCIVWFERINMASNPANEPSRNTSCSEQLERSEPHALRVQAQGVICEVCASRGDLNNPPCMWWKKILV